MHFLYSLSFNLPDLNWPKEQSTSIRYLWPKIYFQPESSSDVESGSVTPRRSSEYAKRRNLMLLAVAYSASIGGTGVVTGTPSNLIILEVLFCFYEITVAGQRYDYDYPPASVASRGVY